MVTTRRPSLERSAGRERARRAWLLCAGAATLGLAVGGCNAIFGLEEPTERFADAGGASGGGGTTTTSSSSGGFGGFESDPQNCGTPGHDCLGGDCASGHCQPYVFDSGYGTPAMLLLDDGVLFVTTWDTGSVMAIDTTTPTPTAEMLAVNQGNPLGMAVDDHYVYYTRAGAGIVSRVPRPGGDPEDLTTGLLLPMFLARVGEVLYVTDYDLGAIVTVPTTGGPFTTIVTPEVRPQFVMAIGAELRWTSLGPDEGDGSDGAIRGGPLPDGPFGDVAGAERRPHWIVGNDTEIFWTSYGLRDGLDGALPGTGALMHKRGDNAPEPLLTELDGPSSLWLDGDRLYWASRTTGDVFRCSRSGSDVELLATDQAEPVGIVGDASSIYWANLDDGTIMRLAK